MPKFRRVKRVPNSAANLAYVAVPEISAEDLVSVSDPNASSGIENRRIMYADLAGRLVDETGDSRIATQHPVVTDLFYDSNSNKILERDELIPEAALAYLYTSKRTYYGKSTYPYGDLFSPVGNENITLVDENGEPYTGRYMLLLKRTTEDGKSVNAGTSDYDLSDHEDMVSYRVFVHLDRADQDLKLRFIAGDVIESNGTYVPSNIDVEHEEDVQAVEYFSYSNIENVVDATSSNICASISTHDGHVVYVPDKALIDPRKIDSFYWRIAADIKRSTPVASTTGQDELKIGVIGTVTDSLASFLSGDSSYSFRMKCTNPYPGTSPWTINTTDAVWSNYDAVLIRTSSIEWNSLWGYAVQVIEGGGVVIIDTPSGSLNIVENLVPYGAQLVTTATRETVAPTGVSAASWIGSLDGGYTISAADLAAICATPASLVCDYGASIIGTDTKSFMLTPYTGVFVSGTGFTDIRSTADKQLFCNMIWGLGAQDPSRSIAAATSVLTLYSPWEISWVAGRTKDENSILSDKEYSDCDFRLTDDGNGNMVDMRFLSDKSAATIVLDHLTKTGDAGKLLGADSVTYRLELGAHDTAFVHAVTSLDATERPRAYSTYVDENAFVVPDAYLVKSFSENTVAGTIVPSNNRISATVKVVGSLNTLKEYPFTWSLSESFSYTTDYASETNVALTSDLVSRVYTWSDLTWTAPHAATEDVRSDNNIEDYGKQTNTKWYPWDGHSFLLSSGSTGPNVKYLQNALNALAAVKRGHRTGKLEVDGAYGAKTRAAVIDYQKRWHLTVDGVVDAGTAGHIMRNAGTTTKYTTLDEIWNTYGRMTNVIDGNSKTYSGRRTWINSRIDLPMIDTIYIALKTPVTIGAIEIEPHMYGDNNLYIHRIGGRLESDNSKNAWAFDKSKDLSHAWKIADGKKGTRSLACTQELDVLKISLYTNKSYNEHHAYQWGVKNAVFYVKAKATETRTANKEQTYNSGECKIHIGETVTYRVTPSVPAAATFKAWNKTAAEIAAAIKSTLPASVTDIVNVSCTIETSGTIVVKFTTVYETSDSEVSAGCALNIQMNKTDLYGIDDETQTGTVTSAASTTVFSDAGKYFIVNDLTGLSVQFTSGGNLGAVRKIVSNTATAITLDSALPVTPSVGHTYRIFGNICRKSVIDVTATGGSTNTLVKTSAGWSTNALAGKQLLFTSGVNDKKVVSIVSNTSDTITFTPALQTVINGVTAKINGGHWPIFDTRDGEDDAWIASYRVEVIDKTDPVLGVFLVTNESGEIVSVLERINYTDILKYGTSNIKIGITNMHVYGNPSQGGSNPHPVRYAMKPYCVIEPSDRADINSYGLEGKLPSEPWGVKVESTTVTRNITIPATVMADAANRNKLSTDATWMKLVAGKTVEAIYRVSTGKFSATHGEPFIDISNEVGRRIGTNAVQFSMTPISVNADGPTLTHSGSATLTVTGVDVDKGIVYFDTSGTDNPETHTITGSYTYRETYIPYFGSAADSDIFDLCPYSGHYITIDGTATKTVDLIGKTIYVYALPIIVRTGSDTQTRTRSLFHTTFADMFDPQSVYYNPLALKVATCTIKATPASDIIIIDTRQGGGGLSDDDAIKLADAYPELFDIGHLDGDAYLKGGTVIVKIPEVWKTTWDSNGVNASEFQTMVEESIRRWVAAGKSVHIEYV